MQIVIDIPKDIYEEIMAHNREMREGSKSAYYFEGLIQNGIPLSKSHGGLMDIKEFIKSINDWADSIDSYEANEEVEIAKTLLQSHARIIVEADKGESEE